MISTGSSWLFPLTLRVAIGLVSVPALQAHAKPVEIHIKPSMTDVSIHQADTPHMALYDPLRRNSKLVVYLTGSDGNHQEVSTEFYSTLVGLGYHVISLTYITQPTATEVCKLANAANSANRDPACAEKLRRKRCFGNDSSLMITDSPADAISNRLNKALMYLVKSDPQGGWSQYVAKDGLYWSHITVTGQGEGGAMAAYIAKNHPVERVVLFSIAKDDGASAGDLADWYSQVPETTGDRWFACYHYLEPNAKIQSDVYRALKIPEAHIVLLHEKIPKGKRIHPADVGNPAYKAQWTRLFGG